jgi:hypothetical protein
MKMVRTERIRFGPRETVIIILAQMLSAYNLYQGWLLIWIQLTRYQWRRAGLGVDTRRLKISQYIRHEVAWHPLGPAPCGSRVLLLGSGYRYCLNNCYRKERRLVGALVRSLVA